MKNVLIATRVLVMLTLLFLPAIAVLLAVAFLSGSTRWFGFIGLPAVLLNLVVVLARRDKIWAWTGSVAERHARP